MAYFSLNTPACTAESYTSTGEITYQEMIAKRLKCSVPWSNPMKWQMRDYLENGRACPHGDRSAILGTPAQRCWETGKQPMGGYQKGKDARTHNLEGQADESAH